jgi:hypothetical protein
MVPSSLTSALSVRLRLCNIKWKDGNAPEWFG